MTDLIIFCDNYKDDKSRIMVNQVRSIVDEYAEHASFKTVTINKADKNKGLANSIKEGVSKIIETHGSVIVLEDDLVTSKFFLRYMNEALEYYKNNMDVWSVTGYSFSMVSLDNYPYDIYSTRRACSWGWATWKDRWERIDWKVYSYNAFRFNPIKRYRFSKWGRDLPGMLDRQVLIGINSWAIIWCYQAFLEDMVTIYPKKSFVQNIGIDGTGEHHAIAFEKFKSVLYDLDEFNLRFENVTIDEKIRHEFRKRYSNGWYIDLKSCVYDLWLRLRVKCEFLKKKEKRK